MEKQMKVLPPETIVIRPPVEAYSLLIPVTGGCSWNTQTGGCRFCGTYKGIYGGVQPYAIRPLEDVLSDIDIYAARHYDGFPVFLAGGNPTSLPTEHLATIVRYVRERITNVPRISCYARALDILRKTDDEIRILAEAGLDIVYMGLESGSDKILRMMRKGVNSKGYIKAGKRLMDAGIKLSLYVIIGLGGYKYSEEHYLETAKVLTEINPTIFRFRTLHLVPGSEIYKEVQEGKFELLRPIDNIREEYLIIKNLGPNVTSAVRNDHISNYCDFESENIKEDREMVLKYLEELLDNPRIQKAQRKLLTRM
jgi:radical SAM superfamily enzyme YgiQ (UPF0313 family)